ncbi:uncharacterized protein N7482_005170 [Penicillium canariense]|uniref:Uncharacterized protein n=1 Tax=Penicillium canariense TaxID=189055 RepID=A0A9W9LLZ0_9EURO|nr:uncharacterized protein N7482_005170 [Penicillium canariense]KAJ5166389.1 hypothetical protein N7482_005170 [Penicillium canariense]
MGTSPPAKNGRPISDQLLNPPQLSQPPPPNPGNKQQARKTLDPNMSNPRLLVNRACIYERQLPGDAYITAHVARLQHGYYASKAVSDKDAEHVDFLAVSFVFHAPHTLAHRFKSATIKAAIRGSHEIPTSPQCPHGYPPSNPRFLMHAPHLIYGHVSPETMEWTFSLAGSLGISETPVSASVIPSGSTSARYRRYEMMRIQGSVRTLKSDRGHQYDVEAGEIVWSLEENNLQRTGLPREFTFVMLIQKPSAKSKLTLSLEVEPVIQAMLGSYPGWILALSPYQPLPRRGVNFGTEIGQRFEPADSARGFNFAALESSFGDYIAMPGRKYTGQIDYPTETPVEPGGNYQTYPPYGNLDALQQMHYNGMVLQNNMLQSQLNQYHYAQTRVQPRMQADTLNVHHNLDNATISLLAGFRSSPAPAISRVFTEASDSQARMAGTTTASSGGGSRIQSYENIRASMLRTVHPELHSDTIQSSSTVRRVQEKERTEKSGSRQQVMRMKNRPLSPGLIARFAEQGRLEDESDVYENAEEQLR